MEWLTKRAECVARDFFVVFWIFLFLFCYVTIRVNGPGLCRALCVVGGNGERLEGTVYFQVGYFL